MRNVLEDAIVNLVRTNRFYAKLLLRLKRVYNPEILTARINIQDKVTLEVNPYFFDNASTDDKIRYLKHEILHVAGDHYRRRLILNPELFDNKKVSIPQFLKNLHESKVHNMAEDIAINQLIHGFPKTSKIYDKDGKVILDEEGNEVIAKFFTVEDLDEYIPNVKRNMAMEYYYHLMQEHGTPEQDQGKNENGERVILMTFDDHSTMGNGQDGDEEKLTQSQKELGKEVLKKLINDTVEECGGIHAGHIPNELRQLIEDMNYKPKDWRKDLASFIARNTQTVAESTRRKKNRRYGWRYPGMRYDPQLNLVIGMDNSGSTKPLIQQFMAEIKEICKQGINITIVQCDCKINSVSKYDPNEELKIFGGGGTDFKPVFDLIASSDFISEYGEPDGLIFLTDGEDYGDLIEKSNIQTLWALPEGYDVRYNWGEKTFITLDNKK